MIKIGDRIRLKQDFDNFPFCVVANGREGIVTEVTDWCVWINLDDKFEGSNGLSGALNFIPEFYEELMNFDTFKLYEGVTPEKFLATVEKIDLEVI